MPVPLHVTGSQIDPGLPPDQAAGRLSLLGVADPTADGAYTLTVTVTAGVPSFAWVSTYAPALDFSDPRNSMYLAILEG